MTGKSILFGGIMVLCDICDATNNRTGSAAFGDRPNLPTQTKKMSLHRWCALHEPRYHLPGSATTHGSTSPAFSPLHPRVVHPRASRVGGKQAPVLFTREPENVTTFSDFSTRWNKNRGRTNFTGVYASHCGANVQTCNLSFLYNPADSSAERGV